MPRAARLLLLFLIAGGGLLLALWIPHRPGSAPARRQLVADASGPPPIAGQLDLLSSDPDLRHLERLVAQDRHTEAFGEAVRLLAARAERDGPFDPATLVMLQWVAAGAAAGGDRETAQDLFEALLPRYRAGRPRADLRLAEILLRRGRLARVYDDPVLARRQIAEARSIIERRGAPASLSAALEQFEGSLWLRSDLEAAGRLSPGSGDTAPRGARGFRHGGQSHLDRLGSRPAGADR
jgi:hypothetical protein